MEIRSPSRAWLTSFAKATGGGPSLQRGRSEWLDAAERRSVRRATADRIVHVVQHEQVLVGTRLAERIEAGQVKLGARFPPAVRAADHPGLNGVADLRLSTNPTYRRFHGDPLAAADPVSRGGLGMDLGGRGRRGLPEAR